jgi:hypothetical protein
LRRSSGRSSSFGGIVKKIKANCPHCTAENQYDRTAAGLHVSCSECGARFVLDYARPQRSCLGSCLTTLLAMVVVGAAAGGLLVYFVGWPLPWGMPFDLPFSEVAEGPPQPAPAPPQPPPVDETAPAPNTSPAPDREPGPETGPESAPEQISQIDAVEETPPIAPSEPAPEPARRTFELREWVDNSGTFRVTARLVQFAGGKVRLEKENGEVIEVPLDRLSENDRNYLMEMFRR